MGYNNIDAKLDQFLRFFDGTAIKPVCVEPFDLDVTTHRVSKAL